MRMWNMKATRRVDGLPVTTRNLAWLAMASASALVLVLFGALTSTPTLTWTSGLLWVLLAAASGLAGSAFRNRHHV